MKAVAVKTQDRSREQLKPIDAVTKDKLNKQLCAFFYEQNQYLLAKLIKSEMP